MNVEPPRGVEPQPATFEASRSIQGAVANETSDDVVRRSGWLESHQRPLASRASALLLSYIQMFEHQPLSFVLIRVRAAGLAPARAWVKATCSAAELRSVVSSRRLDLHQRLRGPKPRALAAELLLDTASSPT